ncbi:Cys-tRNA(Pro) deacylase [Halomonas sp. LR5S13]|uniref:Cys-tRNA(Pro) deacylase n=1 Tax=Halomonas rhizosphaerae TaxID=3043296 RepID=UPI0024A9D5A7|nr:Cys-tRNA(Pro) deacylase [Halomonas rhizosphaerae]MDI5919630.1 Cys-tRNA(Pro) deacylase [Halomonas rhizosphaerae]
MTPAVKVLEQAGVAFTLAEYDHDPRSPTYGEEAARALGLSPEAVFKTLLARLDDGRLVMAMVPVSAQLDLKALARAAGSRKASLADPAEAERATGYVVGGISPLGQRKRLAAFLDISAERLATLHVSGGRRGLEICLAPDDLARLTGACLAALARR